MRETTSPRTRRWSPALLAALALFAASCSGDSSETADPSDDPSSSESGSDTDSGSDPEPEPDADPEPDPDPDPDPEPDAEPEPEPEPAGPDVRTLALMPDPVGSTDPLETVNHLPSVQVFDATAAGEGEEGIAFVFDSFPEVGNRILITPDGLELFCDMWPDGETVRVECGGYNMTDGTFLEQMPIPQVDMALGYGFIVPMTIEGGVVTITHNGTAYSASEVRVAQEPAFVQIDVNTGGLAAEVIRTVGIVTGAELEVALA